MAVLVYRKNNITVTVPALSQETLNRAQADFLVQGEPERTLSFVALSYFCPREDNFPRSAR